MSKSEENYLKEKIDDFEVNYKSLYDYCNEHNIDYKETCTQYNINPDENSKKEYFINLKTEEVYKFINYDYFEDGNQNYRIKLPKTTTINEDDFKDQLNKGKKYYKKFSDKHCKNKERFNCIKEFTDLIDNKCEKLNEDDYDRGIKKRNCDLNRIIDEYQQMQEPHQEQNYILVQSEQPMQYPHQSQQQMLYPHQSLQSIQQPMPQQILHPHQSLQPMQQPHQHPMQYMIPPHGMQNMMQQQIPLPHPVQSPHSMMQYIQGQGMQNMMPQQMQHLPPTYHNHDPYGELDDALLFADDSHTPPSSPVNYPVNN